MTEDEAKTKWCPFARVVCYDDQAPPEYIPPANRAAIREGGDIRINESPEHARCIGSACMAWRTRERPIIDDAAAMLAPKREETAAVPQAPSAPRTVATGYCGLAGSPTP